MIHEIKGLISNIQRTSVHDGPGIRTTVFFKGCNMHCVWCHNPEAIHAKPEYIFNQQLCLHCGFCDQGCYSGAKMLCGKEMDVHEVMKEVLMDKPYYADTGGITISGGEPFMQSDFLVEILKAAQKQGIHCGIETNASMPFGTMARALPYVDVWMVDLKTFTDDIHKKYTGVSNEMIKNNIKELDRHDVKIVLRTPFVPAVNDDPAEIEKIVAFAANLKHIDYYEILPYHPLGLSKQVENTEFIQRFEAPDKHKLNEMVMPIVSKYAVRFRLANSKMAEV